jgi:hypothetical protein
MRSSYGAIRRLVALLAVSFLAVTAMYADDPSSPFTPLEARISPPTGISSQARISPPTGSPVSDARIKPPTGYPTPDDPTGTARILPPSGVAGQEPSFFDLLLAWLCTQARIGVPIG